MEKDYTLTAGSSKVLWTPLHAQLQRTLRQRQLLQPQQRLLVAVSGGQDSLCLIQLLRDLQPKWQWQLGIAHCNHRWRDDAAANADYVGQLAEGWGLPYHYEIAAQVLASEADARVWRYAVLGQLAHLHNYQCVLTGHTASDRAETLLYNLLRGSGADGLQALDWQRPLSSATDLIRPLLEVTRQETAAFCQQMALQVWIDQTNQDLRYRRNRIRQELLPYLQQHFNPQVEHNLAQTAELLRADVACLETISQQWLAIATQIDTGELTELAHQCPRLNRHLLQPLPLAIQRRVIRQFLQQHLNQAPNFAQIDQVVMLLRAPNRSRSAPLQQSLIAEVAEPWIELRQLSTSQQAQEVN